MALEDLTGTSKYIDDLVNTNPVGGSDYLSDGDNHIRGIKNVLLNTFPNIDGAVTPTPAELNSLAGRQSFVDTLLQAATTQAALAAVGFTSLSGAAGKVPVVNSGETGFDYAFALPTGALVPYAGSAAPSGFLLCYGQAISRTTYATLFTAIGTTYGVGDGATTFNLPDLRGRVVAGQDDMGGASADRLTAGSKAALDGDTLGATGGVEEYALLEAEMPRHDHNLSLDRGQGQIDALSNGDGIMGASDNGGLASMTSSSDISNTGNNEAHTNVQPTIVLNYIIKT
jgi:microcystin-dependent protein